jgi:hypothetical protein
MPIEPLTQQQSWVREKRAFTPHPAKLGEGRKVVFGIITSGIVTFFPLNMEGFYVRDVYIVPNSYS